LKALGEELLGFQVFSKQRDDKPGKKQTNKQT